MTFGKAGRDDVMFICDGVIYIRYLCRIYMMSVQNIYSDCAIYILWLCEVYMLHLDVVMEEDFCAFLESFGILCSEVACVPAL